MPKRSTENELGKNTAKLTAAAALSRVLGYVRDAAVVAFFGGGLLSDIFYSALRITNFLRRTVGEGALNAAFLPAMKKSAGDFDGGKNFLNSVFCATVILAALLTAAGLIWTRAIVTAISYGFTAQPAAFELAVILTRVLLAQTFFILLSSALQSALLARDRFFRAAAAPLAYSVVMIAYVAFLILIKAQPSPAAITGLAVAAVLGSAAQIPLLMRALHRTGHVFSLINPFKCERTKRAAAMMGPALFCSAGDQISMFIGMAFASFLGAGSITAVYNSMRIMQMPLALFGAAGATAALAQFAGADDKKAGGIFSRAVLAAGFLLIPATVGLLVLAPQIVQVLFVHGSFSPDQGTLTAGALRFYALALAAHALNKITVMAFYARGDWKFPAQVIFIQTAAECALAILLIPSMKLAGVALASAISAWLAAGLLYCFNKTILPEKSMLAEIARFVFCAATMGAACALTVRAVHASGRYVTLAAAIAVGAGVYFAVAKLTGIKLSDYLPSGEK